MFENIEPMKSLLADTASVFGYLRFVNIVSGGRGEDTVQRARLWRLVSGHYSTNFTWIVLGSCLAWGAVPVRAVPNCFIFRSSYV